MYIDWLTLYDWQELVGAVIGAATPLCFWFFTEWQRNRREYKEKLENIERTIVYNINSTLDTKRTLLKFVSTQLDPLIEGVKNTPLNQYCAGTSFFPLFEFGFIDDKALNGGSKSSYIDNSLLHLHRMGQDMRSSFADIRRQFEQTILFAREMAMNKCNAPEAHNLEYMQNLIRFKMVLIQDALDSNIRVYLESLIKARVALTELRKIGLLRWRLKYNKYKKIGLLKMEEIFEKEYQKELKEILDSEETVTPGGTELIPRG